MYLNVRDTVELAVIHAGVRSRMTVAFSLLALAPITRLRDAARVTLALAPAGLTVTPTVEMESEGAAPSTMQAVSCSTVKVTEEVALKVGSAADALAVKWPGSRRAARE